MSRIAPQRGSTRIRVPAGYRYAHFSTFGTMTARGGQFTAMNHCFERRPVPAG